MTSYKTRKTAGDTALTQSTESKRLYLYLQKYPFGKISVKNLDGKVEYAQFLHDGSEILFDGEKDGSVSFKLPAIKPDVVVPVIEIILK